jgi:hypothetical protein
MAYLYVVAEGVRDDLFYDLITERITGRPFERPQDFRIRPGSNWKTALAAGKLLLNRLKHWDGPQAVAVILAIDNDRAPGNPGTVLPHPLPLRGHDLRKTPRYPAVTAMIAEAFTEDRDDWPVDVAVAMPVEMLESWVLLLSNPARPALPLFAEATQASARAYYGHKPPNQLKDLVKLEAAAAGVTVDEYFWYAAEQDLDAGAAASPSFAMFLDQVRQWREHRREG